MDRLQRPILCSNYIYLSYVIMKWNRQKCCQQSAKTSVVKLQVISQNIKSIYVSLGISVIVCQQWLRQWLGVIRSWVVITNVNQYHPWSIAPRRDKFHKVFREHHPRPAEIRKCKHWLGVAISNSDLLRGTLYHANKFRAVMWFPHIS